jgi:hypothetical protein
MSDNLAQEYADSMWQGITDDLENGTPFGIREEDDGYGDAGEELTAYDYLQDVLDIKYTVNSAREYLGARICIGYGGPNVWIDTNTNALEVYWGQTVTRYLRSEFINALDEALEELWDMGG